MTERRWCLTTLKELSENGFLTMPSAEAKHSGDYQLVAVNKAGRMEKEVKLFVIKEDDPSPYVARKQSSFSLFPVDQFGDYVTKSHSSDNRDFKDQYTVSYQGAYTNRVYDMYRN